MQNIWKKKSTKNRLLLTNVYLMVHIDKGLRYGMVSYTVTVTPIYAKYNGKKTSQNTERRVEKKTQNKDLTYKKKTLDTILFTNIDWTKIIILCIAIHTTLFFALFASFSVAAWIEFESIGKLDSIVIWKTHAFIIHAIEAWIYCSFLTVSFFFCVCLRACECSGYIQYDLYVCCTTAAAAAVITVHLHVQVHVHMRTASHTKYCTSHVLMVHISACSVRSATQFK